MSAIDPDGFDYEAGLFEVDQDPKLVPVKPKEKLSAGALTKRKVARRIGGGEHPLGQGIRLHPDAPHDLDYDEAQRSEATGPRCGSCVFRVQISHHNKRYPKCHLPTVIGGRETFPRDSASDASDVFAWWPACTNWKAI